MDSTCHPSKWILLGYKYLRAGKLWQSEQSRQAEHLIDKSGKINYK